MCERGDAERMAGGTIDVENLLRRRRGLGDPAECRHATRFLQASLKLARARGVANLIVVHRPSDFAASGSDGSVTARITEGLLADCETLVCFAQADSELAGRETALRPLGLRDETCLAPPQGGRALARRGQAVPRRAPALPDRARHGRYRCHARQRLLVIGVDRRRRTTRSSGSPLDLHVERRVLLVGGVVIAAAAVVWLSSGVASVVSGHGVHDVRLSEAVRLLFAVAAHPADPSSAFPQRLHADVPSAAAFWLVVAGVVLVALTIGFASSRAVRRPRPRKRGAQANPGWAGAQDLAPLLVARPSRGRLVVGRFGNSLVATETGHSLLVVGPTQSGKTTGLAIPAILDWDGPVVATSVKSDLVASTATERARVGLVSVYDPLAVSGGRRASWSPLIAATTWLGAREGRGVALLGATR